MDFEVMILKCMGFELGTELIVRIVIGKLIHSCGNVRNVYLFVSIVCLVHLDEQL